LNIFSINTDQNNIFFFYIYIYTKKNVLIYIFRFEMHFIKKKKIKKKLNCFNCHNINKIDCGYFKYCKKEDDQLVQYKENSFVILLTLKSC